MNPYQPLPIPGAFVLEPVVHGDARGGLHEWYKADEFTEAAGHPFLPAQGNMSASAAGVVRGVHFADVPPGQAKMVTCPHGRVLDVLVDLRVGSPSFGEHHVVELGGDAKRVVYLPIGVGHAFVSLEEGSVVAYLLSDAYAPEREHAVDPRDPELGLDLPGLLGGLEPVMSERDLAAPSLAEARESGLLPSWDDCREFEAQLRDGWETAMGGE
ncbi:dTDP-4-dehydrorhamnose 3,5-epimerase family protein [Corynebacterium sp. 335C]